MSFITRGISGMIVESNDITQCLPLSVAVFTREHSEKSPTQ